MRCVRPTHNEQNKTASASGSEHSRVKGRGEDSWMVGKIGSISCPKIDQRSVVRWPTVQGWEPIRGQAGCVCQDGRQGLPWALNIDTWSFSSHVLLDEGQTLKVLSLRPGWESLELTDAWFHSACQIRAQSPGITFSAGTAPPPLM